RKKDCFRLFQKGQRQMPVNKFFAKIVKIFELTNFVKNPCSKVDRIVIKNRLFVEFLQIICLVVEKMGLEPTTFWLPAKRSSQLSYIPLMMRANISVFPLF